MQTEQLKEITFTLCNPVFCSHARSLNYYVCVCVGSAYKGLLATSKQTNTRVKNRQTHITSRIIRDIAFQRADCDISIKKKKIGERKGGEGREPDENKKVRGEKSNSSVFRSSFFFTFFFSLENRDFKHVTFA